MDEKAGTPEMSSEKLGLSFTSLEPNSGLFPVVSKKRLSLLNHVDRQRKITSCLVACCVYSSREFQETQDADFQRHQAVDHFHSFGGGQRLRLRTIQGRFREGVCPALTKAPRK